MQNYLTDKLENDAQIHNDIVGNDLKVVPYNIIMNLCVVFQFIG